MSLKRNFIKKTSLCLTLGVLYTPLAFANEIPEITIYATRAPIIKTQLGNTYTILNQEEIEASAALMGTDLLRQVPGLDISSNGSKGSLSSIRLRGTEANHVLVLIDGVEASDYATSGASYDFSTLLASDIERIEVLRGAQSGLWGSDALGGVINIITKEPEIGASMRALIEGGSLTTQRNTIGLNFGNKRAGIDISGTYFDTDGDNIARIGNEEDGTRILSGRIKGRLQLNDHHELKANARIQDKKAQSDGQSFVTGLVTDSADFSKSNEMAIGASLTSKFFNERFTSSLSSEISQTKLSFTSAFGTFPYEGEHKKLSWNGLLKLPSQSNHFSHQINLFTDIEENSTKGFAGPTAAQVQKNKGIGAEYRFGLYERFYASASVRHDKNDQFKNATTWRLTGSYLFPSSGTRLHASAATGIKNPSPFELYGFFANFVGNPNLKPEESLSFDAGIEQSLWGGLIVSDITFFQNRVTDLITGFGNTAINLNGTSKISGIEATLSIRPTVFMDISAFYTWQNGQDSNQLELIRRPKHKGGLATNIRFANNKANFNAKATYVGSAKDSNFTLGRLKLDDYIQVNAKLSYDIDKKKQIYIRGENLLNQKIENVYSYRNPGIEIFAGLKMSLGE